MALAQLAADAGIHAHPARRIGGVGHSLFELTSRDLEVRREPRARRRDLRVVEALPQRVPAAIASGRGRAARQAVGHEVDPRSIELVGAARRLYEKSLVSRFSALTIAVGLT